MATFFRHSLAFTALSLAVSAGGQIPFSDPHPAEALPPPEMQQLAPPPAAPQPRSEARGPQATNGIAAVVEDRIITFDEVRREIALLVPQLQRDSRNEQEFQQRLRLLEDEVIQSLVDRVLIVKHFEEKGFTIPRSYLENELEDLIRTDFDGDRGRFLRYLQSQGISVRDFRETLRERIIVQYMRGQMQRSESIVSPALMEKFYEEKKHTFYQEEAIHLRIIELSSLTNESEDVLLQTAEKILSEVANNGDFKELAKKYSQGRRRKDGGDWSWIETNELREDWRTIVAELKVGQASKPLKTDEVIYIPSLEDYREAGIQPISEVRDEIETILAGQMARADQERWLERLRKNAYVRYYL